MKIGKGYGTRTCQRGFHVCAIVRAGRLERSPTAHCYCVDLKTTIYGTFRRQGEEWACCGCGQIYGARAGVRAILNLGSGEVVTKGPMPGTGLKGDKRPHRTKGR